MSEDSRVKQNAEPPLIAMHGLGKVFLTEEIETRACGDRL